MAVVQNVWNGNPEGFHLGNGDKTLFSVPSVEQVISTDNVDLLNSDVNSSLRITNDVTGNPATSYTVGMKAGVRDGQVCIIHVAQLYAIELSGSVPNSALIIFNNGATGSMTGNNTRTFKWNAQTSIWEEWNM